MYCAVINGPSLTQINAQIKIAESQADMLEIRWDLFDSFEYCLSSKLPMIFTLRPTAQGGNYRDSESDRLTLIKKLLMLRPDYLDIEYFVPKSFLEECKKIHPSLKIIRSFHDFEKTPEEMEAILNSMQDGVADFYKIACMAKTTTDSLRMLNFLKNAPKSTLGICMGEKGLLNRIYKSLWSYCAIDDQNLSAPGQLSLQTIKTKYGQALHAETLYGLIGDPIYSSISDFTHNPVLHHFDSSSFYIKMPVSLQDLGGFLEQFRFLPFRGLSVTMPLKEAILPYLDTIDPTAKKIGAVNTLLLRDHKLYGFNTDGIGALQAIKAKMEVKNKTVIVLGAGGAARAIIYELQEEGAKVIILNRHQERAAILAEEFGCLKGESLDAIDVYAKQGYDLLINCTPVMPISDEHILKGCNVMDIKTRPKMTPFLQAAQERHCNLIYGYEMFVNQACGQFRIWNGWDPKEVSTILQRNLNFKLDSKVGL